MVSVFSYTIAGDQSNYHFILFIGITMILRTLLINMHSRFMQHFFESFASNSVYFIFNLD